jgi:hypothetical protein
MFLDLLDLHIPILHVPLDSWLGMIRNKRQRTDEFRECTTNAARGQTVKYVIDKAPRIVLRNDPRSLSFPTIPMQCKQNQISFRNVDLVVRGTANESKQVSPHQHIRCLSIIMCEWLGRRLVNKNEGGHHRNPGPGLSNPF